MLFSTVIYCPLLERVLNISFALLDNYRLARIAESGLGFGPACPLHCLGGCQSCRKALDRTGSIAAVEILLDLRPRPQAEGSCAPKSDVCDTIESQGISSTNTQDSKNADIKKKCPSESIGTHSSDVIPTGLERMRRPTEPFLLPQEVK